MHSGVSAIQAINQNRLNGRPHTSGSTRSHSGTVKHIAVKGIAASSKAVGVGFLTAFQSTAQQHFGSGMLM